jgi:hypothetical protein
MKTDLGYEIPVLHHMCKAAAAPSGWRRVWGTKSQSRAISVGSRLLPIGD